MSGEFTVDAGGWVAAARKLPSPNVEARPQGAVPTLIVVHNISLPPDEFGGTAIAELFLNTLDCNAHPYYDAHLRGVRVSAHFVIHRDDALEQFVSCNERAWHAGPSNFFGRERCNDFSIGIELEGSDTTAFESMKDTSIAGTERTGSADAITCTGPPSPGSTAIRPSPRYTSGSGSDSARHAPIRRTSLAGRCGVSPGA